MQKTIIKQPILKKALLGKYCFFLLIITCSTSAFAKDKYDDPTSPTSFTVSGKVTDNKGVGLSGATITEKGTANSTISGAGGSFTINVQNQSVTLVVSYVGYVTKEIPVNRSHSNLVVELISADASLETIVVVGYGTQKKLSSTAAISTIKGEELAEAPVANISNSLAGRVSGVMMNANGGRPGADNPDIFIRGIATTGNNAPLIVVDGVIRNNINEIDPNIIATVTILKDAAAVAPYGLGGANGVILIYDQKRHFFQAYTKLW